MTEVGLLMAEDVDIHKIGGFCNPVQNPDDLYAVFGTVEHQDRVALKPVANQLAENAREVLVKYIGCVPSSR